MTPASNSEAAGRQAWPTELRLNPARDCLTVTFDNGESFALAAEYLRVESPSAEVRGHGGGPKLIVRGKEQVTIRALEPVGNYAVRILFDDGHDSGLYSWDFLLTLGRDHARIWAAHLEAISRAARG
jgi:DUF971 family protein